MQQERGEKQKKPHVNKYKNLERQAVTGSVEEVIKISIVLLLIIVVLLILLASAKLLLTAYVAWTVENNFQQPSEKDMQRLIRWCTKKYIQDLFRKS